MLKKFKSLFKFKPKRFLGVDVGASYIRLIEIERKGLDFKLANYGEIGASSFREKHFNIVKKNNLSLSDKEIGKSIQAVVKEAGMQAKEISFSIPDFCTFFTRINLPVMDKNEIAQAVRYQVRPYVPLPLDDVVLDWSIVEGQPSKTDLKILVVAIPNDVIDQYREIAKIADLKLKFLEPEVFALARSTIKNGQEKKVIGLIDIGARSTTCSILERGTLKISHSFNIAGNELTDVIARSLNMDYNKAEAIKRKYGMLPNNELEGLEKTRKLLLPLIGSILEEIKKAFRSFYLQEGKEIDKIVLAGGLSLMPGLKEFFSAELKKEVVIADPFLNISCPAVLTDILKEIGPYYGTALGLALKGLE